MNSMELLSGGQSISDIFRTPVVAGNYTFKKYDDSAAAAAASDAFRLDTYTEETKPRPQSDGTMNVDIVNHGDGEDFDKLLKAMARPATSAGINLPEFYNEKGVKTGGATANLPDGVIIIYGSKNAAGTKMRVYTIFGNIDPTSGELSQKSTDYTNPSFKWAGKKTEHVLTVPKELYNASLVTVSANVVIASGDCYSIDWFPVAA